MKLDVLLLDCFDDDEGIVFLLIGCFMFWMLSLSDTLNLIADNDIKGAKGGMVTFASFRVVSVCWKHMGVSSPCGSAEPTV